MHTHTGENSKKMLGYYAEMSYVRMSQDAFKGQEYLTNTKNLSAKFPINVWLLCRNVLCKNVSRYI